MLLQTNVLCRWICKLKSFLNQDSPLQIKLLLDYYNNHCLILLQIWVQSPHNASGYYTIYGDDSSYQDHFNARLVTGNTGELYARTGYLGFLRRTEAIGSDGGKWLKTAKNHHIGWKYFLQCLSCIMSFEFMTFGPFMDESGTESFLIY